MLQIFILLLLMKSAKNMEGSEMCHVALEGSTTPQPPCGSYGFRCVDEITYQICGTFDSEGNIETPEFSRECSRGLVCDEESPAFCSPIDEEMVAAKKFNEISLKKRENLFGEMFDKNGEEITSCYKDLEMTTGIPEPNDEDATQSFVHSEFDCPGYGQYPDSSNKSMYWICDSSINAIGFTVHHVSCGAHRFFEPRLRECVTVGTTRDIRSAVSKQSLLRICRINRKTHRFRLKRGDCDNYYLCYNHNRDVMKMRCPRYYQFSDRYSQCMPESLVDCNAQNKEDDVEDEYSGYYDL